MKQRSSSKQETRAAAGPIDPRISIRLDLPIAERFERIVTASKRSKTSIIEECLEGHLPKLEKQYQAA
jgi:predicted DNA-binding protein